MKYLLQREDGKYVARPGLKSSYTWNPLSARIFDASELERERCGNETAIPWDEIHVTHSK